MYGFRLAAGYLPPLQASSMLAYHFRCCFYRTLNIILLFIRKSSVLYVFHKIESRKISSGFIVDRRLDHLNESIGLEAGAPD